MQQTSSRYTGSSSLLLQWHTPKWNSSWSRSSRTVGALCFEMFYVGGFNVEGLSIDLHIKMRTDFSNKGDTCI